MNVMCPICMDAEIEAAIAFAKRLNFDAVADFEGHHHPPKESIRIPQQQFYLI